MLTSAKISYLIKSNTYWDEVTNHSKRFPFLFADIISKNNLQLPMVFAFFCIFSFYSEIENYHYYKYFFKVNIFIYIIYMMIKLENFSKEFYDKYFYADFTAIALILSFPSKCFFPTNY